MSTSAMTRPIGRHGPGSVGVDAQSRSAHGGNIAGRWIDNLLPDNDEVRQRWATHFGESGPMLSICCGTWVPVRQSRTGLADQHCTGHRCRK